MSIADYRKPTWRDILSVDYEDAERMVRESSNTSPESIRAGVAHLKQMFARHGLERMPADSFLEEAVAQIVGAVELERERQTDVLLRR